MYSDKASVTPNQVSDRRKSSPRRLPRGAVVFQPRNPLERAFLIDVRAALDMVAVKDNRDLLFPLMHKFGQEALLPALRVAWQRNGYLPPWDETFIRQITRKTPMTKPRLWKPGSFRKVKPGEQGYKSKTAPQYRILRGSRAGEVVSNAERFKLRFGLHPTKLSEARKAGVRGYESAASQAQAAKSVETRHRLSRKSKWFRPNEVTGRHVFLNKAGAEQRATFNGRNLAITQTYREDVHGRYDREGNQKIAGALQTGDGSVLKKYDRMKIYDVDGNRVYPETNINKLRRWWDGKAVRSRNLFESELYQSDERLAA